MNKKTNAGAQAFEKSRLRLRHRALPLLLAGAFGLVSANPQNPQVVHGQATFHQQGNVFTITNTPNAIINWQNFSVGAGEITRFVQQGADSAVLNRITGQNPTQILGALQSNGRVFLINPNGVLFGANARVDVNGLVASSLNISNQDFLDGKHRFSAGDKAGAVRNEGAIATPTGGSVYLIAPDVNNSGVITTPKGDVVLAAGRQVELVDSRNPELHVVVAAPADQAVNLGQVVAQGGRIGIYGALVNQRGTVNANSAVVGENGKIVLKASDTTLLEQGSATAATGAGRGGDIKVLGKQVGLTGNAQVDASGAQGGGSVMIGGDYLGQNASVPNAERTYVGNDAVVRADGGTTGDGGRVIVWGNELTRFFGTISAAGGSNAGNGGFVETSGKQTLEAAGQVRVGAANGARGTWLLDPTGITISTATGGLTNGGGIFNGSGSSYINNLTLGLALVDGDVSLHSSANIEINAPVVFDSSSDLLRTLKLKAKDNINFGTAGKLEATNGAKLHVEMYAGAKEDFSTDEGGLRESGIVMASGSSIITNGGNIVAVAKKGSTTTSKVQLGTVSTHRVDGNLYGALDIKTKGGDIVQTGAWTVGIADFDLGDGSMRGNIVLERTTNEFHSDLAIANAGSVRLKSATHVTLAGLSASGAVTVTAKGIGQYNDLVIGGDSNFIATGTDVEVDGIYLGSPGNDFTGLVSASAAASDIFIENTEASGKTLKVGTMTASAGSVELEAGAISVRGTVTGDGIFMLGDSTVTVESTGKLQSSDLVDIWFDGPGTLVNKGSIKGNSVQLEVTGLKLETGSMIEAVDDVSVTTAVPIILGGPGTSTAELDLSAAQLGRIKADYLYFDNYYTTPALLSTEESTILTSSSPGITVGSSGFTPLVNHLNLLTDGVLDIGGPINMVGTTKDVYLSATGGVQGGGRIRTHALSVYSEGGIGSSALPLQTEVAELHLVNDSTGAPINVKNSSFTLPLVIDMAVQGTDGDIMIQNNLDMIVNDVITTGSSNIALVAGRSMTVNNVVSTGSGAIELYAGYGDKASATPSYGAPLLVTGTLDNTGAKTLKAGGAVTTTEATLIGTAPTVVADNFTGPTLAECIANKHLTGCAAILPTIEQCKLTPSLSGCTVVLPPPAPPAPPTLSECVANPARAGCGSVLPSIAQCVSNPQQTGCGAVLPTVNTCKTNPTQAGCEVVLPPLATCTANPKAPGCDAVLPNVNACTANPKAPGCEAVLPPLAACVANPSQAGCSAVLPKLDACIANPTAAGCTAVLPPLNVCVSQPQTAGCVAVLPTIGVCTANPQAPGCSQVLPKFDTCVATPTLPGCAAVLPSVNACIANPTANGCAVVLPPLAMCTANPSTPGCAAVLPKMATCLSNPAAVGCSAVLPSVGTCVANPAAQGCGVVLPTLSACTSNPSQAGCSAVLPTLATCTASPATQGCSGVLPSVSACVANPTAPGCSVVVPPTQAAPDTPVGQAVSSTANVINNATKTAAAPKLTTPRTPVKPPAPEKPATQAAGSSQPQSQAAAPAAGSSASGGSAGEPGPAAGSGEKKEEKTEQKDTPATADKGEAKNEPAKKMYCN